MVASIILTIGSLLFLILLYMAYFSKDRFSSIRNKLYRYMLIIIVILVMSEIIQVLSTGVLHDDTMNILFQKIHWSTGIIWMTLLNYYSMVAISDIETRNVKELIKYNKSTKVKAVLAVLFYLVYIFIPIDKLDINNLSYIPGAAAYYTLAFCALSVADIVIYTLINGRNASVRKKLSVWLMILELLVIFGFQVLFRDIAFLAMGSVIQMYFLYFNIENPDIETAQEIIEVKDNIERANKAKTDFLSNMSHEIRTPMNAIVGFSDSLLNATEFDEEQARADLQHIYNASNNLLDIVNNILDISKIESDRETLEERPYNLSKVLMELSSIIEARLGNKPVKLIMDVDKTVPSSLYGDQTKLFSVLLNLLTNAVKYTEVGKITLTVRGERDVSIEKLHFKVSDTGYGIKKEDYDKLFSKFSRLEDATKKEIEGTGLGLVIIKKYVDLMGGKIWFESEYQAGTTFYVDIEQKIMNNQSIGDINEPIKPESDIKIIDCSKYKVLVVDDNKLNLKVAAKLLSKYNFQVETLESGKECIDKVKSGEHYDLIFTDHMMPEMDGIETLHILKSLEGYTLPPIIVLTANAITGMKEMYLNEGFDEYLSKPINIQELNKLILKYFDNKE